jgi:hypothetical protein
VLDVSTQLILKRRMKLGYCCNCGPAGHTMKMDDAYKQRWTCDMVLCPDCYNTRVEKMGSSGRKRNRRKNNRE